MFSNFDYEIFVKLGISAVLGLIIGLERQFKRKPMGLKTSLVISIISCLLTIVSIEAAYTAPKAEKIQMDPLRLAAQIVSGIGFLGAGVILKKENDNITGLTTAALVWGAGGIGIAVGAGFYIEACAGVILLLISVEIIPTLIRLLGMQKGRITNISLRVSTDSKDAIELIINEINKQVTSIDNIHIKDTKDKGYFISLKLSISDQKSITQFYYTISNIPLIKHTEVQSL